jgi:threonine/homoserine/homoserine lactone efflux protein
VPSPSTLALFSVTTLVLLVTPGPAVIHIVTRTLGQGRRAGLVSVLGIHTGSVVHVVAAPFGVSAVLARPPTPSASSSWPEPPTWSTSGCSA